MSQTTETTETPEAAPPRRPIAGPSAWRGAELGDDWIRPLPVGAPDEIDAALAGVKARGLAWCDITRAHGTPKGTNRARAPRRLQRAGRKTCDAGSSIVMCSRSLVDIESAEAPDPARQDDE